MSNEKRIHDYLSGDLTPDEERRLFDDLSANPHWQEELTLQLKIQQATQKDLGSVVVPPSTTSAIFSSLHFAAPELPRAAAQRSVATGFGQKVLTTGGYSLFFSTTAMAMAMACLLYLVFRPLDNAVAPSSNNNTVHSSTTIDSMPIQEIVSVPVINSSTARVKKRRSEVPVNYKESEQQRMVLNEPIKVYFDIGKFSSVDYLTQRKIIGVTDLGKIYCSDDGGRSWALQMSGTSNDLFGINFIDTSNGIVVGANGTILVTSDAGRQWQQVRSGVAVNLITVRYATQDTVYACGAHGTIMRSTTSGQDWERLESGTTASLFKIRFDNGSNGIVSGEHSLVLETHNAGETWKSK